MANDKVTPEEFKAAKAQFAAVENAIVQGYLDMAEIWVTTDWPEKLYDTAVISATCHLMTLDGLGTSPEAKSFSSGQSDMQSIKSGSLTLTRFARTASNDAMTFKSWLGQTSCGRMFYQLVLRRTVAVPRVAMGGIQSGIPSYAAKDWPPQFGWYQ